MGSEEKVEIANSWTIRAPKFMVMNQKPHLYTLPVHHVDETYSDEMVLKYKYVCRINHLYMLILFILHQYYGTSKCIDMNLCV